MQASKGFDMCRKNPTAATASGIHLLDPDEDFVEFLRDGGL
jgi:hypothetical protein